MPMFRCSQFRHGQCRYDPLQVVWCLSHHRNTDYVLVPKERADAAVAALIEDGWRFRENSEAPRDSLGTQL